MEHSRTAGRIAAGVTAVAIMTAGPVAPPAATAATGDVRGKVTWIVDGDTIHVRLGSKIEKVRVIGVDTPELAKRECYATQAKAATSQLVNGKTVILRADRTQPDRDRYGRLLRHVVLTDDTLLAQRLISNGFGRELTVGRPYIGRPTYRKDQATAKAKKRGLWKACPAVAPRPATPKPAPNTPATKKTTKKTTTKKPTTTKPTTKPTGSCVIKGNIASDGERIYHVPGQRFYDVTQIDTRKGERWFCTTTDARNAGWRAAKI